MADDQIELPEQYVRELVEAALQLGRDRNFPGLASEERDGDPQKGMEVRRLGPRSAAVARC